MSHLDGHCANGPASVVERGGSGETHPVDEANSQPRPSVEPRLGKEGQSRCGLKMPHSFEGCRTVSISSSGYVSSDSAPSSPLSPFSRPEKSTQTPSPSSQVITHAVQRLGQTQAHRGPSYEPCSFQLSAHSARPTVAVALAAASVEDMQPVESVAHELRRIGDEFDALHFRRAPLDGNGLAALAHVQRQFPNGPGVMLFLGILIGRLFQYILRRR